MWARESNSSIHQFQTKTMSNSSVNSSKQTNAFVVYTHTNTNDNKLDINNLCHLFHIFESIKKEKEANKETLTICRTLCAKHQLVISPRALAKRFARYVCNSEKFDERQIFNARTEIMFVSILEAFSLLDRPLSRQSFFDYVINKRNLNRPWNPSGWFSNFMKRFSSNIAVRTLCSINEDRSIRASYHTFNEFADDFERIIFENSIIDENKLNIDETRFSINLDQMKLKGIVSIRKLVPAYQVPKHHPCASYVPVINNHKIVISFLVIPVSMVNKVELNANKSSYQTRRGSAPMFILYTDSGFVNTNSWLFMLKKIAELYYNQQNYSKKILIMDNLAIHSSTESIELCFKHNITPLFLPKYSSHVTQPLDQLVFANLKKEFRSNIIKKLPFLQPERAICLELTQLFDNITNIITVSTIKKSWKDCCLIPWNKQEWLLRGQQVCKTTSENKNETIAEELISMVMNIVPYVVNNNKSNNEESNISTSQTSNEITNYFPSSSTKKKKKSLSPAPKPINPEGMIQNHVDKPKKLKNIRILCSCQFHEDAETEVGGIENSWEACQYCKLFRLCNVCYSSFPEIIVSHEQTCNMLSTKKRQKKQKSD